MAVSYSHDEEGVVGVLNAQASSSVVLVCEHASAIIPAEYNHLGIQPSHRSSHAVWDPGAFAVASSLAKEMEAKLIFSKVSRLIYDCNRAPDAADAMPARSEIIEVPGNADLSPEERQKRIDTFYKPFRNRLARELAATKLPTLITIHSFTPVYNGKKRDVEIGLLHDQDQRLAVAMFETSQNHTSHIVRLNEPYGADDGVTHTLHEHGVKNGYPNIMLEIRNDLIATTSQQTGMAKVLSAWLADTLKTLKTEKAAE